jgi:SAM-dependent methyltransferase
MHQYDERFYAFIARGARRSARIVLPLIQATLAPQSLLDVGCGAGAWMAEALSLGIGDVLGIDGDYVPPASRLIPDERFLPHNVGEPFDLGRRFDLVMSLEVAEHLPASAAATFVANLVRHGDRILFSAAPPGQGGEHHVNEQPYAYWRDLFAAQGYLLVDWLRPQLTGNVDVEPWYRHNLLFFIREDARRALPESIGRHTIPAGAAVPDISPWLHQCQKAIVRCLPPALVTVLAKLGYRTWLTLSPRS